MSGSKKMPPGPKGHWLYGMMPQVLEDGLNWRLRLREEWGDVVFYRFLRRPSLAVYHPDDIQHVLVDNHANYYKEFLPGSSFEQLMGNGLLASNGEFWKRQRRLAQPAFHRKRLLGMAEMMPRATADMLEGWRQQKLGEVEVTSAMMALALRIAGETLFSQDLSDDASVVGSAFSKILSRNLFPTGAAAAYYVLWRAAPVLPRPRDRRFEAELARLHDVVDRVIADRRENPEDRGDLLSMFLAARDEETGEAMDDKQLRDEVMTMLLAGHETTANALAWTFYLLSENPPVEKELHAELDSVLDGRLPTPSDLEQLPLTGMIFRESMRIYPPAPVFIRKAAAADEIGGYHIEAGTTVVISPWATHRYPDFWPDPECFDPERFRSDQLPGGHHFAYLPFGGGPRRCIGNNFALMEGQLVLATVCQRYRLRLKPGHSVVPESRITLRPKFGLPMILEER